MLGGVRLQYFIRHILFPALFTSILCLFFFFFLLLHIKFKIVFNSSTGGRRARRSQIQDGSTILRQVNFLYIHSLFFFILHLHLCHVRLLRACWVTYSSSFPSTKITPPPPRASGQTSDLHSQLWVFPTQTKDIVCVSIEATGGDEMFNLVRLCVEQTRLAGAAPSEGAQWFHLGDQRDEVGYAPIVRETHTQHTNAHTYIFTLFSVALCSFVFPCRDTENGYLTQEKECSR